jgi:hypothetical protein
MYSEKNCPSAALSTTNPTCYPDANSGRRGEKPATNRLSYVTAKSSLRSQQLIIRSKNLRILWNPGGSLQYSQKPASGPYPDLDESSSYLPILFL